MQISVVIPAYNSSHFLPQCLESVLRQTCPVAETIVVDDGSQDNTREVVKTYQDSVRYFWRPNSGVSSARNAGVRQTVSPWVAFLDADDRWDPRKIELQVKALQSKPEAGFSYTGKLLIGSDGLQTVCGAVPADRLWPMLRYANPIAPSTVMLRRELFEKAGGFDEKLAACEDWDMWFRLGPECQMVAVEEPLTLYRVTPNSLSRDTDRMLAALEAMLATSLLKDLHGLERRSWRQRAWCAELSRCAIIARELGDPRSLSLLLRSLATWPSPFFLPWRWKALLVYLFRRNPAGPAVAPGTATK